MTENGSRTGAARDVPPPRPVTPSVSAAPVEETGLGRAARAVADAVAGLIGPAPDGDSPTGDGRRSAASGLRDVLGAVAGAVGGAFAPGRDREPSVPPAAGDRSPGALLGDLLDHDALNEEARRHLGGTQDAIATLRRLLSVRLH